MSPTTGRTKAEDYIGAPNRPFTGKEYLESLRDGREIYIYGERVPDVTTHPAFRKRCAQHRENSMTRCTTLPPRTC